MEIAPTPDSRRPWGDAATPYDELGGDDGVRALVEVFYDIVETESPVLSAMLPNNTSSSRQKLYEFLSGWMGGPALYMERRGHPRLRLRHMPFDIGSFEAREWMRCMMKALDTVGAGERLSGFLQTELGRTAEGLRNRPDPGVIVPSA
jgi:hemoglobin